ncbi:hypothetical protein PS273GM_00695 [Stutzerimonas stutzeri]|uniref:DUF2933 domain-containing protein n=1 Tax=Stutzerimonas stutzeri TaxID=316 RepID=A0A172WJY6_STUST|nr:hypothetical protein PS273GM_00695 [Stutzerimonas stutzeri]
MGSLYSKAKSVLQRNPIVTGLTVAVVGYLLMNQSSEALAPTLPGLLYLLPCLLMMVMCMKHMSGGKCDKTEDLGSKTRPS